MAACTIQEFDIRDESDGEYGRCGQSDGPNVSNSRADSFRT
jgi:hypothetical protein